MPPADLATVDREGIGHPVLVTGIRNIVEALSAAASRLLDSYSGLEQSFLDDHVDAIRHLRQVDRLLVIVVSSGGALARESIARVVWPLSLARSCLHAFALRRMYDAGVTVQAGVDPSLPISTNVQLYSTLPSADRAAVESTLQSLLSIFRRVVEMCDARETGPISDGWERLLFGVVGEVARISRRTLGNLARWIEQTAGSPDHGRGSELPDALARQLLDTFTEIDRVSDTLRKFESVVDNLCADIMRKYHLCAIQIIRRDDIIETVVGEGLAARWVGFAKHRLAQEQKLRDVQADIALRQRAEVIRGWDPRFDEFIYKTYNHEALVRAWVPLVIFRDEQGTLLTNPPANCWVVDEDPDGVHGELVIALRTPPGLQADVIGTIETGFDISKVPKKTIGVSAAMELAEDATRSAVRIHEHSFERAIERALERMMDMAGGDSASLHFREDDVQPRGRFHYFISWKGQQGRLQKTDHSRPLGSIGAPPRTGGLGDRALRERRALVLPDVTRGETAATLEQFNPKIYEEGVRAMAAVPLGMGRHEVLVYCHYRGAPPDPDALLATELLAARYADVFGTVLDHVDASERFQQAIVLNRVVQSLMDPRAYRTSRELCYAIAWNTANLFAADVVTVHEFDDKTDRFARNPPFAGRLRHPEVLGGRIKKNDVRWRVLNAAEPQFEPRLNAKPLFPELRQTRNTPTFAEREQIVSMAAVPLRKGAERMGVLFIDYRHSHDFSVREKKMMLALGDACSGLLSEFRRARTTGSNRARVPTRPLDKLFDAYNERISPAKPTATDPNALPDIASVFARPATTRGGDA